MALATLQRVVNADQQVMQRHRNTIIAPWKDIDAFFFPQSLFFQDYHTHPFYKYTTASLSHFKSTNKGKVNLVFSDMFSV